jgi:hypothetical protein
MTELALKPLELNERDAWGLTARETEHDKKVAIAVQPDLAKLEVGQKLEVMDPIYRTATVAQVQLAPDPRVIADCRSEIVGQDDKGKRVVAVNEWKELWGMRTIPTMDYDNDIRAVHKSEQGPILIDPRPEDIPKTTYVAVLNEQGRSQLHMEQSALIHTRVMVVPDASEKPQAKKVS